MISPVLISARWKTLLLKSWTKLSRPMKLVGAPRPFQLKKAYQPASPIGRMMKTVKRTSAGGRKMSAVVSPPRV